MCTEYVLASCALTLRSLRRLFRTVLTLVRACSVRPPQFQGALREQHGPEEVLRRVRDRWLLVVRSAGVMTPIAVPVALPLGFTRETTAQALKVSLQTLIRPSAVQEAAGLPCWQPRSTPGLGPQPVSVPGGLGCQVPAAPAAPARHVQTHCHQPCRPRPRLI